MSYHSPGPEQADLSGFIHRLPGQEMSERHGHEDDCDVSDLLEV